MIKVKIIEIEFTEKLSFNKTKLNWCKIVQPLKNIDVTFEKFFGNSTNWDNTSPPSTADCNVNLSIE